LTFPYLEENFSEKQLQQFSYLLAKRILSIDGISQDVRTHCRSYHNEQKQKYTPLTELDFLYVIEGDYFAKNLNTFVSDLNSTQDF